MEVAQIIPIINFKLISSSAILAFIVMLVMLALPARFSKALGNIQKTKSRKVSFSKPSYEASI
jgi:hypothetical protein